MARKVRTPKESRQLILEILDIAKERVASNFQLVKSFDSSEDTHKLELTVEFFDPDILKPVFLE